ncbi:MAG: hypothetical protein B6I22_04890 [Desulfobacteraceae bacterium 4572_123]|nr:MAG: hypothetical protein B6I22_04890 [Desulfobacteraceae bacterium 4572_123]
MLKMLQLNFIPEVRNNISTRLAILRTVVKLLLILPGICANVSLLSSAAKLYTAYTSVFIKDKVRAKKLTDKALHYALRAVCARRPEACSIRTSRYHAFVDIIAGMNVKDVPVLYTLGEAWAGWIQAHKDSLIAIAELSRVEAIMKHVVELNELYEDGGAHFYLGVFSTLLPPALGGRAEEGRRHFEQAIEISGGRNLMVKVTFARQYARLMFDRKLHDRLLREVLEADPNVPGYTLINTLARKEAQELLDSADNYF